MDSTPKMMRLILEWGLLAAMASGSLLQAASAIRPNILWIIADDLSPDLGCYGEQTAAVSTPHLDGLAREGVRYTRMFGTSSVCSPNRSAFNTGMYQTRIGAHQHRTSVKQPLPDGVVTIPELFRRAGYFVSNGVPSANAALPMTRPGKVDWNFSVEGEPFDGTDWSQRAPDQPFFAQVNINEAHRPWTRDMQRPVDPTKVDLPPYHPEHPLVRLDWAQYLEEVQVFDRKVGAILQRLKSEGLADSTIVMVFGDNGRSFPRDKGYLYDSGLRVPLIVRWPDGRRAGAVDDRLLSMIDLGSSSLEWAGIPPPAHLDGASFADERWPGRDVIFAAKDRTGVEPDRIRIVRTGRFKYIRNFRSGVPYLPLSPYTLLTEPTLAAMLNDPKKASPNELVTRLVTGVRPAEELYDVESDPFETRNLADDPRHAAVLADLRSRLERWVEETRDQGVEPEDPALIEPYIQWMDGYLARLRERMGVKELTPDAMYAYWMNKYDLM
jgi:uncharacterized sulfatase